MMVVEVAVTTTETVTAFDNLTRGGSETPSEGASSSWRSATSLEHTPLGLPPTNARATHQTRTAVLFASETLEVLWFAPKDVLVWLYLNHVRDICRNDVPAGSLTSSKALCLSSA